MFIDSEIAYAIDMQKRSYRLLKWVAVGVSEKRLDFHIVHKSSQFTDSAEAWIRSNYASLPRDTATADIDIHAFACFFSTYLENSFDLIENPGKHLYSPDAHCFCPLCSWLIQAPSLKAKKLTTADKKKAVKLKATAIRQTASENEIPATNQQVKNLLTKRSLREDSALVAYGYDLLVRVKGIANGPAVLALWRDFAWTPLGSPKPKFDLNTTLICDAQKRLIEELKTSL